ncbi:MAG: YncE family protein [Gemmatimonadaceae bacterium]
MKNSIARGARSGALPIVIIAAVAASAARPIAKTIQSVVSTGTLLVANQRSASATLIDLSSGVARSIPVGEGPHEAAISPNGRVGVVTIYGAQTPGNELAVIDIPSGAVTRTISLGAYTRPHGVVFVPGSNERVVVTSEASQNIVLVDVSRGIVEEAIGTLAQVSHMVGVTANGQRAFTANIVSGSVSEFDLRERRLIRAIPVGPRSEGIGVAPDGSTVWAGSNTEGTVSVIDVAAGKVVSTLQGFQLPYRIAISANGALAIICDPQGDKIHVADVAQRKVLWSLDALGSPRGVSISPDASTAFITLNGDRSVAVVDLAARKLIKKFPVGDSPDGVAYGPAPR